ncbi:hypothetical protein F2P56_008639 [Juglans regia]|uniref:Uncharacterized protein LOC109009877 n=2 Tax=Juglans regia TaxID=51240 RepID=A0A2I4GQA9_JUGRE|nr:uncharacterized protein LOC109009877 [Juglans regia]KAF5471875.1 hypothetical protein F2P56_008639 [Juglans regia]
MDLITRLSSNSNLPKGFHLQQGLIIKNGRIVIVPDSPFKAKVLHFIHDDPLADHWGYLKTYQRAKRDFIWKGMKRDIKKLVRECLLCQTVKNETTAPAGLLQPLPTPQQPWADISMDFIEGLPKSNGFTIILVVVDHLTKLGHFIPLAHPYTASIVVYLFMKHVFKLRGLPKSIVSDRDPVFVSSFWKNLFTLQGSSLNYNSAYHPQNKKRVEQQFSEGDWVYLRLQPYRQASLATRRNMKLSPRFYGPFQITKRVGVVAYRLDLPTTAKIHPTFHVSCLKRKVGDTIQPLSTLPPVDTHDEILLEPEAIVERRIKRHGNQPFTEVLVKWSGLSEEDNTWESYWKLKNLYPHLVGKGRRHDRSGKPTIQTIREMIVLLERQFYKELSGANADDGGAYMISVQEAPVIYSADGLAEYLCIPKLRDAYLNMLPRESDPSGDAETP